MIEDKNEWPRYPYPGIRPFDFSEERNESLIFYGREAQVNELIGILSTSQFVAVLGPSGCGKSSLIRAGLIPKLERGYLHKAGRHWTAVKIEPGSNPVKNLSRAFITASHKKQSNFLDRYSVDKLEKRFLKRSDALVELFDEAEGSSIFNDNSNVLLLVDQFEEIFRRDLCSDKDASDLIDLLLNVFHDPPERLFVVLTMRTDSIDKCSGYPGLPGVLTKTMYLVDKIDRAGIRDAITKPIRSPFYNGIVDPKFLRWIENSMATEGLYDSDTLPLMQHAVLSAWQKAKTNKEHSSSEEKLVLSNRNDDFNNLAELLSQDADSILETIKNNGQLHIAETMLRLLGKKESDGSYNRRVTSPEEIATISKCKIKEAQEVINEFTNERVSFLRWKENETKVDISHESLIRKWKKFTELVDDETQKANSFKNLLRKAGEAAQIAGRGNDDDSCYFTGYFASQLNNICERVKIIFSIFSDKINFLNRSQVDDYIKLWGEAGSIENWAERYIKEQDGHSKCSFKTAEKYLNDSKWRNTSLRYIRYSFAGLFVLSVFWGGWRYVEDQKEAFIEEFNKGMEASKSGKSDVAIKHFKSAIKEKDDYPQAHFYLGEEYAKVLNKGGESEYREMAVDSYIRTIDEDGDKRYQIAHVKLIENLLILNKKDVSKYDPYSHYDKIGKIILPDQNLQIGTLFLNHNSFKSIDKSIGCFKGVIENKDRLTGEKYIPYLELGKAIFTKINLYSPQLIDQSETTYQGYSMSENEKIELTREALKNLNKAYDLSNKEDTGICRMILNRYIHSKEGFSLMYSENKSHGSPHINILSNYHCASLTDHANYGHYLFKEEHFSDATKVLERVVENQKGDEKAQTLLNIAYSYFQNGKYSIALSRYQEALLIDKYLTEAYWGAEFCYRHLGEHDKAKTAKTRAQGMAVWKWNKYATTDERE